MASLGHSSVPMGEGNTLSSAHPPLTQLLLNLISLGKRVVAAGSLSMLLRRFQGLSTARQLLKTKTRSRQPTHP